MFPAWHIALTALVTAAVTTGGTAAWPGHQPWRTALGDLLGVGIAAGLGVLLWRLGANVSTLNDDPIPGVSPADVLSGPLAYVAASTYARLRGRAGTGASERMAIAPAVAASVALVINIVTI
jgi:hypothetical protein